MQVLGCRLYGSGCMNLLLGDYAPFIEAVEPMMEGGRGVHASLKWLLANTLPPYRGTSPIRKHPPTLGPP